MPLAYPFRWPTGPDNCGPEALAQVISKIDKEVGATNVAAIVIEPIAGEGGFIVPARRLPRRPGRLRAAPTASSSSPTRCRPASHAPAPWFACEHEGVVPDLITHRQGHRRRPAARRGHRSRRDHGRAARRRPRRHLRRQPGRLRRRARRHRDDRGRRTSWAQRRGSARSCCPRLRDLQARYPVIGDVRGRGAMIAVELVKPGSKDADAAAASAVAASATARACSC